MEFCPKCGLALVQKGKRDVCPRCKYSTKNKSKLKISEKIEEKRRVNVISDKDTEVYPIIDLEKSCEKCGHKKHTSGRYRQGQQMKQKQSSSSV